MIKTLVAMSGGVDSSAVAFLLTKEEMQVEGATLKLLEGRSSQDIADARAVCDELKIPFRVYEWEDDFKKEVISRWADTYWEGKTPNPCIFCNEKIKFGKLIDVAVAEGFDKIATGHYARIEEKNGRFLLKRGLDKDKDQSYVLYGLTQFQLAHALFPLGNMSKEEVRKIAEKEHLTTAHKSDSQDICFISDGDYTKFLCEFSGKTSPEGNFVTRDGHILGKHKGLIHYTIGQRKGLGLALPAPAYVYRLDTENNAVILSDEPALFTDTLFVEKANWILFDELKEPLRVEAKVRYRHEAQPATIYPLEDNRVKVIFDTPQRAITPGQSAVFYDGDYVVGGGIIE